MTGLALAVAIALVSSPALGQRESQQELPSMITTPGSTSDQRFVILDVWDASEPFLSLQLSLDNWMRADPLIDDVLTAGHACDSVAYEGALRALEALAHENTATLEWIRIRQAHRILPDRYDAQRFSDALSDKEAFDRLLNLLGAQRGRTREQLQGSKACNTGTRSADQPSSTPEATAPADKCETLADLERLVAEAEKHARLDERETKFAADVKRALENMENASLKDFSWKTGDANRTAPGATDEPRDPMDELVRSIEKTLDERIRSAEEREKDSKSKLDHAREALRNAPPCAEPQNRPKVALPSAPATSGVEPKCQGGGLAPAVECIPTLDRGGR
jgi:hypothetical protein